MQMIQLVFAQTNAMLNNQIAYVEVAHLLYALRNHIVGEAKKIQNQLQYLVEIIYASTKMPMVNVQRLVLQGKLNALVGIISIFAPIIKFAKMLMIKSVFAQTNVMLDSQIAFVAQPNKYFALLTNIVGQMKAIQNKLQMLVEFITVLIKKPQVNVFQSANKKRRIVFVDPIKKSVRLAKFA